MADVLWSVRSHGCDRNDHGTQYRNDRLSPHGSGATMSNVDLNRARQPS